nr:hypothetical protein KXZ65_20395 [Pectobacterium sp. PL152]
MPESPKPQWYGALSILKHFFATLVSQSHYDASSVVSYHELQDNFFSFRTIRAQLLASELDENIQLVTLNFTYGGSQPPLVFSRNNMAAKTFCASVITDPVTKKRHGQWNISLHCILTVRSVV